MLSIRVSIIYFKQTIGNVSVSSKNEGRRFICIFSLSYWPENAVRRNHGVYLAINLITFWLKIYSFYAIFFIISTRYIPVTLFYLLRNYFLPKVGNNNCSVKLIKLNTIKYYTGWTDLAISHAFLCHPFQSKKISKSAIRSFMADSVLMHRSFGSWSHS